MEQALKDLRSILNVDAVDMKTLKKVQSKLIEEWINSYVEEFEVENSVIKTNLTSEEEDFLKYYLAVQVAEKLIDDHSTVISEDKKIKIKILALKKHFPKNKEG